ncbi:MAG: EAL domain-containing protein [Candidatus Baltobacteraceae bacterium]
MSNRDLARVEYREPWYLLGILLLGSLLATLAVSEFTRAQIAEHTAQTDAMQRFTLQRVSAHVDDFATNAAQLAGAAALQVCTVRNDPKLVERLLRGLLVSRINNNIYGVGCFFEPNAFRSGLSWYGPYAQFGAHGLRVEPNNDGSYKYRAMGWYRYAVSAHGALAPYGPFKDVTRSFVTFSKAFYAGRRLAGVASVDTLAESFGNIIGVQPKAGDQIYLTGRTGKRSLSFGHLAPRAEVVDLSVPIRFTRGRVHVAMDRSGMLATNRQLLWLGLVLLIAIWGIAIVLAGLLLRSWHAKRKAIEMQLAQARLEQEITLQRAVEAHLRKVAYVDVLTGLSNRTLIVDALGALFKERAAFPPLVLFIDIDAFSLVNDTLGHESGDSLLLAIAGLLRKEFEGDVVARFGADEFVVLVCAAAAEASAYAARVKQALAQPVSIRGREIRVTASLGIVLVDGSYHRAEDVLRDAEIAMYSAKGHSRASFEVFTSGMRRQLELDAQLEHNLHRGIAEDEFGVNYQPIIDLRSGSVVSLEALARWDRMDGTVLQPSAFIPYAENHGLVSAIDSLVMRRVCSELMRFVALSPRLTVAVNCSMAQLTSHDIVAFTLSLLKKHQIPASHLRLEITETSVMKNAEYALKSIQKLRALGVLTVVDDFGTGYSSLAYLQRLPISGVKIDRSFIAPLGESAQATAIVRSVIALADTLGLYTVAEGIETAQQLAILVDLGATFGQGFFFSKPVPFGEAQLLLSKSYLAAS